MVENTTDPKQVNTFQKYITNSHFVYIHTRISAAIKLCMYTELTVLVVNRCPP